MTGSATLSFDRLRRMTLAEVGCRGRQEAAKLFDRVSTGARGWNRSAALLAREAPDLADPEKARERLREMAGGRFFAGASQPDVLGRFAWRWPDAERDVVGAADSICRKRFDLLGYRGLHFGDPVDWHLDPVSGRRAPRLHWSQISPLDTSQVGDSKVIWELNRHQWLVTLAQAHLMTGREAYLTTAGDLFDSWLAENPPGLGINWSSSLEVSVRLIAWCWAVILLRETSWLSAERLGRLLAAIQAHATHIERYLSYYFSPNTHLTGEALGLFYAGVVFREFRQARRWRDLGWMILVTQSTRQIADDGVYVEQATCYQRYTIEIYLHFLILADRHGIAVPASVRTRVVQMLEFLLSVGQPAGTMPDIGDADSGWLLPLTPRARHDCRGVFSVAAVVFARPDFAWAAGSVSPEVAWMFGVGGLAQFARLRPAPPETPPSRAFQTSGYAVMRDAWTPDARRLIVDVGPIGRDISGAHGHADLLSLQCSAHGDDYLIDPGTFGYADPPWRNHFRSTGAHSTIVIDRVGQAQPAGAFSWRTRPTARLREWTSTHDLDFLDADHDAFSILRDPVRHRRRVLFVKPRYWVVVDDLSGSAEHHVELRFQFAARPLELRPDLWTSAPGSAQAGLWLKPFSTTPLLGTVHVGEELPSKGWIAPDYGRRCPAPLVAYAAVARCPMRIVTLMKPVDRLGSAPPEVQPILNETGQIIGLTLIEEGETIHVDDEALSVERYHVVSH